MPRKKAAPKEATDPDAMFINIDELRKAVKKNNNDDLSLGISRQFLGSALEAVKTAELAYKNNPHAHNSYALNGLMNQARELAADIRQLEQVQVTKSEENYKIIENSMKRLGFQVIQQLLLLMPLIKQLPKNNQKSFQVANQKITGNISSIITEVGLQLMEELK